MRYVYCHFNEPMVETYIKLRRLQCAVRVVRMDDKTEKRVLVGSIEVQRSKDRQRERLGDAVAEDAREGLRVRGWKSNKEWWRVKIEEAKARLRSVAP